MMRFGAARRMQAQPVVGMIGRAPLIVMVRHKIIALALQAEHC